MVLILYMSLLLINAVLLYSFLETGKTIESLKEERAELYIKIIQLKKQLYPNGWED